VDEYKKMGLKPFKDGSFTQSWKQQLKDAKLAER